ncbi:serine aminopeptidase domain-containing protein [Parvularcula sp. IMCC14364]|uniref:serine aminopeptidase domain-containing protein n=1 Tax=Parvularcula sp. IMCC14364 TaxID=3067902 RepID=UPI0027423FAC|nr:alpha/beta hydrolase [Parvularcula sp. IMCC14364]
MTPLHFGPSAAPLYGVYHPAKQPSGRAPAILLCSPFGVEAIRAFRIYRILAEKLAAAGSPVLRFDYTGTGNAAGDDTAFSVTSAVEDILIAHQELTDMSGATRVAWLGLRLGAGLALLASQRKPRALGGVCLWDPVTDGSDYLQAIQSAHVTELARVFDQSEKSAASMRQKTGSRAEAMGFALGDALQSGMDELSLAAIKSRPARHMAIIAGEQQHELEQHLEATGVKLVAHTDEESQSWNSDAALNAFSVPRKTLDLLVETLGELR